MKKTQKRAIAVGAGVAALAAAAAGVYFLTGKKNAGRRKAIGRWAVGLQKDVVKQLKKARNTSKTTYNKVVDEVVSNYKMTKKASAPELAALARELKSHWDVIRTEVNKASKSVKKLKPKAKTKTKR